MNQQMRKTEKEWQGLYSPQFEHDNCGIGAVVNIRGQKNHGIVEKALKIVENLEHRAGKDAEGKTGDGVGILLQISHNFFSEVCEKSGITLGAEREYAVGMFFFPQNELKRNQAKKMFEIIVEKEGLELLGWRTVPVFPEVLGHKAKECMPCIMQAFVKKPEDVEKIFQLQKELIERYEDLSSINCEKVFAWCKKKIQVTMQDYRRIMIKKELAGYFALHKEASGEWELDDLYLFPQFQNQGIGTQVVRDIIEQTTPQPLMLYVFTQNTGAVRLYERLGFVFSQEVGTTRIILRYHRT